MFCGNSHVQAALGYTPAAVDKEKTEKYPLRCIFECGDSDYIGPANDEDSFIQNADVRIESACSSPGIYLIIWATNQLDPSQCMIALATIAIQVIIPLRVILGSLVDDPHLFEIRAGKGDAWIKISAFVLTSFLSSTFVGTIDRIYGNTLLVQTKPGYAWVPGFGATFTYVSVVLTCIATYSLFRSSPNVTDQLLNCVALNFVPDVGVSLVSMLEMAGPRNFDAAKARLTKLAEAWPDSTDRDCMMGWVRLPWFEKFAKAPTMFMANVFNKLIFVYILGVPFLTVYTM